MQGVKLEVWVPTFAKVLSNIVELVVEVLLAVSPAPVAAAHAASSRTKEQVANSTMVREGGSGESGSRHRTTH